MYELRRCHFGAVVHGCPHCDGFHSDRTWYEEYEIDYVDL
jgi:hypothetical protein